MKKILYKPGKPTLKQISKVPLTEEEHESLILPARASLTRMRAGSQDVNDWYNLSFRIKLGLYASKFLCSAEDTKLIQEGLDATNELLYDYRQNNSFNWSSMGGQLARMTTAIELTEQIQLASDRKTLIFCTRKAYNEMKAFTTDRSPTARKT